MIPTIVLKSDKIIDEFLLESDFIDILLKNRNLKSSDYDNFFNPNFPASSDFNLDELQIKKAVTRINKAIKNKENILIYGDYDVDGITATAILWQVLYQKGAKVLPFIPDRETDGYGIRSKSFFNFEKQKYIHFDLLITVDNGIVANKEIEKISQNKTDVIIIDHHLPTEKLPKALAIIHSTEVSGAALSWFFATFFDPSADIGLAAAGTVTDCLPLLGVNRNIVIHGLNSLRKNPSHGIKKLIEISGIKQDSLSAYDLAFVIGPRINAVGRLSNPTEALRLLCSQTLDQASSFAKNLDKFNKDRQNIQKDNLKLAENNIDISNKLIFVSNQEFLPGIIGLIAGRLTEKYYLPSVIISVGDEYSKASCRSIKELNIIETLRLFNDDLVELGGHAGAAGFTIKTKNIAKFKNKITDFINQQFKEVDLKPSIIVDAEMKLPAVTIKNCQLISKFEPFGIENNKPLFLFKNVCISQKRAIGSGSDHLKLKFSNVDAIAFKKGHLDKDLKIGDFIDIIASLDLNNWNNQTTPQLVVKEIFFPSNKT